ncbi:HEPN domain-containing protein [bacterium]|nr:MAG: HEPN domain-containing protein [bacterium]
MTSSCIKIDKVIAYLTPLNKTSKRWNVWLRQAEFDIAASRISFNNHFFEWSCYQSEQAVEKALKSVLVFSGYRPPKVHKIALLVAMCNSANSNFKHIQFRFKTIESLTFISRYPFLVPGEQGTPHEYISERDAAESLEEAIDILDKIRTLLYVK